MEYITQIDLANYEEVPAPKVEKSNFAFSFSILPKEERNAINSVYSFCSYIDSIVDTDNFADNKKTEHIKLERLRRWELELDNIYSFYDDDVSSISKLHLSGKKLLIAPLAFAVKRFKIPKQYFITLIDGCRRDILQSRYNTFDELKEYCYAVASIVGLISIEIFGYKYEETRNYAINLGYALQLTNIMRDVKFDKQRGYIYLPLEDLKRFDYSEEDLINEVYNDKFIDLMQFQAKRVRKYYHQARTALHPDEKITLFAAEVMDSIYYRLLEKIELNDFNVYSRKIRVSTAHKLYITFKHWLSASLLISRIKKKR